MKARIKTQLTENGTVRYLVQCKCFGLFWRTVNCYYELAHALDTAQDYANYNTHVWSVEDAKNELRKQRENDEDAC